MKNSELYNNQLEVRSLNPKAPLQLTKLFYLKTKIIWLAPLTKMEGSIINKISYLLITTKIPFPIFIKKKKIIINIIIKNIRSIKIISNLWTNQMLMAVLSSINNKLITNWEVWLWYSTSLITKQWLQIIIWDIDPKFTMQGWLHTN